jgi:hypothetical protein
MARSRCYRLAPFNCCLAPIHGRTAAISDNHGRLPPRTERPANRFRWCRNCSSKPTGGWAMTMSDSSSTISRAREARDHLDRRAIAPAGEAHAWPARHRAPDSSAGVADSSTASAYSACSPRAVRRENSKVGRSPDPMRTTAFHPISPTRIVRLARIAENRPAGVDRQSGQAGSAQAQSFRVDLTVLDSRRSFRRRPGSVGRQAMGLYSRLLGNWCTHMAVKLRS